MSPEEREAQVESLFQRAKDLSPSEQIQFLNEMCDPDESIRDEIQLLLNADRDFNASATLNGPQGILPGQNVEDIADLDERMKGRRVGPYEITKRVGTGGYGCVYQATRTEGFAQKVAIKLIRADLGDNDSIHRRFEIERQVLSDLDHPYIARLIDGGCMDDGRPYFAMEYVDGQTITEYCEMSQLDIDDRLRLFQKVCGAVAYAHQFSVVHRDIKPSNILVTADGAPKLLDFGIAKLTDIRTQRRMSSITETGQLPMTPDYASPEQLTGKPIGQTSDVYSLGVVLYELLTGCRPFRVESRLLQDYVQAICNHPPSKPSTSVMKTGDKSPPSATGQLRKKLIGDVDNIVLMALRKEPQRRYQSAHDFAEDIQRYFERLPVMARRDSAVYRAGKFVSRNRSAVLSGCVILLALIATTTGISIGWRNTKTAAAQLRKSLYATEQLAETYHEQLYEAEISSAYEAWEFGNLPSVEDLLLKQIPIPNSGTQQKDLRGFEWYYLADLVRENEGDSLELDKEVTDVALNRRNETLFAVLENQEVRRIDLVNRHSETILQSSYDDGFAPQCVAVSAVGGRLAIGGHVNDGSIEGCGKIVVRGLNNEDGYEVPSDANVCSVAFSPDGQLGASRNEIGTIQVWNAETGDRQWRKPFRVENASPRISPIGAIAFSPDGEMLVAAFGQGDGDVVFWEATTGDEQFRDELDDRYLRDVAFSPDGSRLAIVGETLHVLNLSTFQSEKVVVGGKRDPKAHLSVTFSPDSKRLALGNHGNTVVIWDLETGYMLKRYLHRKSVPFVAYSLDGSKLFSVSLNSIRISRDSEVVLQDVPAIPEMSLAVDGNSNRIALPGHGNEVLLWDLDRAEPYRLVGHKDAVKSMTFSRDSRLLASGDDDGSIRIWDTTTKKEINEFPFKTGDGEPTQVIVMACSPVSGVLAVGGDSISGWEFSTGKPLWSGVGHKTKAMIFSSDGRLFTAGGDAWTRVGTADEGSGLITVWNVDGTPTQLGDPLIHDGFVVYLAIWESAEGGDSLLAAGDRSGKITVYDARTMKPRVPPLTGHTIGVTALGFGPNGKILISAGWDGTMRIWSVESGRQIGLIQNYPNCIYEVNCLPSRPGQQRFLTVAKERRMPSQLTIRRINMLDPDLSSLVSARKLYHPENYGVF